MEILLPSTRVLDLELYLHEQDINLTKSQKEVLKDFTNSGNGIGRDLLLFLLKERAKIYSKDFGSFVDENRMPISKNLIISTVERLEQINALKYNLLTRSYTVLNPEEFDYKSIERILKEEIIKRKFYKEKTKRDILERLDDDFIRHRDALEQTIDSIYGYRLTYIKEEIDRTIEQTDEQTLVKHDIDIYKHFSQLLTTVFDACKSGEKKETEILSFYNQEKKKTLEYLSNLKT